MIRALVSDFGGVLTSPLMDSFVAFQDSSGVPLMALYSSIARIAERTGVSPLHRLETGQISERDFLAEVGGELTAALGRPVDLEGFGATYFAGLRPNEAMFELLRELRDAGIRLAICTNNVREWEARWRALVPVQELFELVIDSAFVGVRKPEPEIYRLTLARLGLPANETLFVDDIAGNCEGARAAGMHAIQFTDNEHTIPAIRAAIADGR